MSSFHFEFLLCLNSQPMPMVKHTLFVIDPGMAESLEGLALAEMEVDLVSFQEFCRAPADLPSRGPAFKEVCVAQEQDPIAPGDS